MFTPKFFKNGLAEEPIYFLILIVGVTLLGVVLQVNISYELTWIFNKFVCLGFYY